MWGEVGRVVVAHGGDGEARPTVVVAGRYGERGGGGAGGGRAARVLVVQAEYGGFALGAARAGARVAFDHALRSEVGLDTITDGEDVAIVLHNL